MTPMRKLLATGMFGFAGSISIAVLVGYIPGAGSDIAFVDQIAGLIATGVETHGQIFTAFGIFLLGIFLSILCLTASSDGYDGGDWDLDGSDGGGCGGGD